SASIAFFHKQLGSQYLATNTGSLYFAHAADMGLFLFASEQFILRKVVECLPAQFRDSLTIEHLNGGEGLKVGLDVLNVEKFSLHRRGQNEKDKILKVAATVSVLEENLDVGARAKKLYSVQNDLKKLKVHDFDYKAIHALRRCSRCILPETTPFIKFDTKGVCSFCREHTKINYRGKKKLEELVEPFRRKGGEPDCIIAFSGGRDSSYGLHYLKEELEMNPIAYTYDWGMVTDLARRNEARMVGKLGVEHVIVSADITMKREHIRKHIQAWMKKPNLGMVPLFMEGDKQCEYYADELARKNNIDLVFYCRGNEFEKEEFKTGHCGIKNADPGGVIHDLSLGGKIKLITYYGWQYLTNPAYINSSIFDTLFAYFSTYIQKHNYVFLWHYIPWDEKKIISTLTEKYCWELPKETKTTWRTDDGTSAFYNYIYYAGQGFTENDSFRARQVREGVLKRKTALELVTEENRPRHEALRWYFDRVGLDGDEVLNVVDGMRRMY
ncbi:hypothetical protein ACFL2V_22245, partial [Pseudomonadota bacterium]